MFDSTRLYRDSVLRHYSGADIVDLDTIRLASSGGGLYTSSNGITLTSSNFKLGGVLTENTSIGAGGYTFSLNNKVYNNTSQRWNEYTDTVNILVNSSKFLHNFHVPSVSSALGTYPNFFAGYKAGNSLAGKGYANTGIGTSSMESMNSDSSAASSNTAVGYQTLKPMVYGLRNVAIGTGAMSGCSAGTFGAPVTANVAVGHHAYRQGIGNYNIAIGASALEDMTTSLTDIIGIGQNALKVNTASFNIGIGYQAGAATTSGGKNTYIGWGSAQSSTTPTENTFVGYLTGGNAVGTSGYNTVVGSEAGKSMIGANTNCFFGRRAGGAITSGISNIYIGNNSGMNGTVDATTGSLNICIGNATSVSAVGASNELNIGNAIFGQNVGGTGTVFTTPRLCFGKRASTANSVLDMGISTLPIILPKSASTPTVGLETAMMYYNSNTNGIDFYSGTSTFVPISKIKPMSIVTSSSGVSANASVYKTTLNATSNAITQTIPTPSAAYGNWELVFQIIGASVNAVTFNIPSSSYVNGVTGATSFNAANGAEVKCSTDVTGSVWIITNK